MKLSEARVICSAATPGPWYVSSGCIYADGSAAIDDDGNCDDARIADMSCDGTKSDRRFIATARTLMPLLLALWEDALEIKGHTHKCTITDSLGCLCGRTTLRETLTALEEAK